MKQPRVVKDPQCRHLDQFVTYDTNYYLGHVLATATCSNCGQSGSDSARMMDEAKSRAKDALMRIEAPPVTNP